jgi:ABC-type branched-subunit amino acid transport system permease subunit
MKSRGSNPAKHYKFNLFGEIFTGVLLPESWMGIGILVIPLLLLGVAAHFFFSESAQIITTTFFINLIAVLGYFTFIGTTGVGVFGHVAFTGIAAHLVALLTLDPSVKARILPNLPDSLLPFQQAISYLVVICLLVRWPDGLISIFKKEEQERR